MVQAIQLSMLTTTADSALRLDGALSDSAAEAGTELSGLGFGEVLNGITSPATNSLSGAKLRHVPAGISVLSGVSQALLAAANAKDTAASAENAENSENAENTENESAAGADEDSLLTSSLLGQIALKDKLPETDSNASDTDAAVVDTATDDVEGEPATVSQGNSQTEIDAKEVANAAKQLAQSASEITDTATTELQAKVNSQISGDSEAGKVADKTQASAGGKGEAQPVAVLAGATESEGDAKSAAVAQFVEEAGFGSDTHDSDSKDNNIKDSSVKVAIETGTKADDNNSKTDDGSIKAGSVAQSAVQADAKTVTAAGTEDNSKTDTTSTGGNLSLTAASDKADNQAGAKAGSEQNASKHDAQQQNGSQQSPSQQNSSQQNQQQGPKQNNNAQLPADIATEMADSSIATAKVAADVSSAARVDTAFSSALQLAEQRQQAGAAQAVARPLAEQLKQSLNLLQQDAAGQLRERVTLMVRQNIQIAEIRLDPAGLGQMQIKIDMQQDQASVQFIVQQSQAKELLEQQLPRLREMLQQQGIQLTEGQVQQQSQQERQLAQRDGNNQGRNGKQTADDTPDATSDTVQVNVKTSDRLVDYYA
ncbi:flagellar hook-length control protein FliK [Rheinheimera hassiensis]|uniref:flagellar hook-length control protein FliK n=1 Tax=Rheinheimera hassiensis TaxID=1193627 RepID=UPI001F05B60A|nr:flagellar hook-length control protein FliK [Rheinheimera hassiensis]